MPPKRKLSPVTGAAEEDCLANIEIVSVKTEVEEYEEPTVDSESESEDEVTDEDGGGAEAEDSRCSVKEAQWSSVACSMKSFQFTKLPLKHQLSEHPYEAFCTMFTEEFLELMVRETNKMARQHVTPWKDVTVGEMLVFIGLVLHTGTIRMNYMHYYWSQHRLLYMTCFMKYMTRDRFIGISKYITFNSELGDVNQYEIIFNKVLPLIDHFNETMKRLVIPGAELSVRRVFPPEEPEERSKRWCAVQLHALYDDNGIVLKYAISAGSEVNNVIMELLEDYLDCGRSVYTKETLTYDIVWKLLDRKSYCTGRLRPSMVMPPAMKIKSSSPRDFFLNNVHIGRWQDLLYVTTEHKDELIEVANPRTGNVKKKPKVVLKFQEAISKNVISGTRKNENGIQDSFIDYYPFEKKGMRWEKRIFINILNQWMINAYLLSPDEPIRTYSQFRLSLLETILPEGPKTRITNSQGVTHTLTKVEKTKFVYKLERGRRVFRKEPVRKDCKRCRTFRKVQRTIYECKDCDKSPGYCPGCFEPAHVSNNIESSL